MQDPCCRRSQLQRRRRSDAASPLSAATAAATTVALLLVLLLLLAPGASRADDAPAAAAGKRRQDDFQAGIVREAVDLSAAHAQGQAAEARDMEGLLHWAIEHSDPAVLAARAGRGGGDGDGDSSGGGEEPEAAVREFLEQKRQRVKELHDAMSSLPTEAGLMRDAVARLTAPGADDAAQLDALEELRALVEPIDNANDLESLGGLAPVVARLGDAHAAAVRAAAAAVVGTAASNNLKFVSRLAAAHPGATAALLAVSQLPDDAAAARGLYALGAVVRGSREARGAFYAASGLAALEQAVARRGAGAERVRTRALHLLTDLMELAHEGARAGEGAADAADVAAGAGQQQQGQQQQGQQEQGQQQQAGAGAAHDEVDRLAASVLPQFASAALHLLQNAESLRGQETALLALQTIVARRPEDGRRALGALGAEGALREALVELEAAMLEGGETDEGGGGGGGGADGSGGSGSGGGDGSSGGNTDDDDDSDAQAYRHYLAGLCADLIEELGGDDGGSEKFDLGHDEL